MKDLQRMKLLVMADTNQDEEFDAFLPESSTRSPRPFRLVSVTE